MRVYVFTLLVWLLVALFCLKFGAAPGADADIVIHLRLPRLLLAMAVGIGLSVSGVVLQALFSNPLCEPYTLGISSGASLGAVIGMTLGLEAAVLGMASSAFLGACLFAMILFVLSYKSGLSQSALLLSGVMLGFLGSSLTALWMALADSAGVQGAIYWLLGGLSRARLSEASLVLGGVTGLAIVLWAQFRSLDSLLLGEELALAMGTDVTRSRRWLLLWVSVMVGLCVSAAGMIGFVGLVVPHFTRRVVGSFHRVLIPLSAIWGATALALADLLSRVLVRPYELPVGVITALIGAPLFVYTLMCRDAESKGLMQ